MIRKLHIGGKVATPGWEVIDALPGPCVDHLGNAGDLARFEDASFAELYASHVLEHFDYNGELQAALREWCRVLVPQGIIYISVPDLDILSELFLSKYQLTAGERFFVMRMMFGGHVDQYDYHVAGLNQEFLSYFLEEAGFANIRRVDSFGIFSDTSDMRFKGKPISLNLLAEKAADKRASKSFTWFRRLWSRSAEHEEPLVPVQGDSV
jgi:predicted SAM-dependent methyltransferase